MWAYILRSFRCYRVTQRQYNTFKSISTLGSKYFSTTAQYFNRNSDPNVLGSWTFLWFHNLSGQTEKTPGWVEVLVLLYFTWVLQLFCDVLPAERCFMLTVESLRSHLNGTVRFVDRCVFLMKINFSLWVLTLIFASWFERPAAAGCSTANTGTGTGPVYSSMCSYSFKRD